VVQTLRDEQQTWRDVVLLLFSSEEAALKFDAGGMSDFRVVVDATGKAVDSEDIGRFRKELRGLYLLDVRHFQEYLTMTPVGLKGGDLYDTQINFPVSASPHCRLEVSNRCVLALQPFIYPKEELKAHTSAAVTLIGAVAKDGTVSASIDPNGAHPAIPDDPLARAALNNLMTWWLEPAASQATFQITYSYVIDPALTANRIDRTLSNQPLAQEGGVVDVQLSLPTQITIRGYPFE
jgi:hypothetical protein